MNWEQVLVPQRYPDLSIADNCINLYIDEMIVAVGEQARRWGRRQFSVLSLLAEHAGMYLQTEEIHDNIWITERYDRQRVINAISLARGHLGPQLGHPKTGAIRNKRPLGYTAVIHL